MFNGNQGLRPIALLERLSAEEKAEDIVEYGLILSFISLAVLGVAFQVGLSLQAIWQNIGDTVASFAQGP